jgi:hypothetical protein
MSSKSMEDWKLGRAEACGRCGTPVDNRGENTMAKTNFTAAEEYIGAMPGWKPEVERYLDALIVRAVPRVRRAVRTLLVLAMMVLVGSLRVFADEPTDLQVWKEFRQAIQSGAMADPERYRPLQPSLLQPMMGYLDEIRKSGTWVDQAGPPEVFHVGNRVHYLARLALRQGDSTSTGTYCFSLVVDGERWYFQHLESIFIRLDTIGQPPVSGFPDLPDEQKAWMRDEVRISRDVRLFGDLSRLIGKQPALDWFKDGAGYALQARAWVPFVSPERAFILYLCWDLSNLQAEHTVLEKLADDEAIVRFTPRAFGIYNAASHLKQQINVDDYRLLFETPWLDRARNSGWDLTISYEEEECVFRFVKRSSGTSPE